MRMDDFRELAVRKIQFRAVTPVPPLLSLMRRKLEGIRAAELRLRLIVLCLVQKGGSLGCEVYVYDCLSTSVRSRRCHTGEES